MVGVIAKMGELKRVKHNYKLTEEDKNSIVLDYYLNRSKENIQDLCNRYNVSSRTIYSIVKQEKYQTQVNGYIEQCKKNFSKKSKIIIDKALNKLNEKIDNEEVSPKDLITLTGVLYDKTRLEDNLSTSNNSIQINLKIER